MKKLVIVVWITLLIVKQDTIVGMEEISTTINGVKLILEKDDITKAENIDGIVHPTNFNLDLDTRIARALAKKNKDWNITKQTFLEQAYNKDFREGERRALSILLTPKSEKQKLQWVINAVGPSGQDPDWKQKLEQTYKDALILANNRELSSLIFPPISTGEFAQDGEGGVIITPTEAANIAITTVAKFIQNYPNDASLGLSLEKIYFIVRLGETDFPHFNAYQQALKKFQYLTKTNPF